MSTEAIKQQVKVECSANGKVMYLVTAGGRIRCLRCMACSVRTGLQCAKPAMKSSRTQKCSHHGGWATGAKTAEGRQRVAQANTKHGESTRNARLEYSKESAQLSMLEDAMHVLAMTSSPRTRGRKPAAYRPVRTIDDVQRMLVECNLHLD